MTLRCPQCNGDRIIIKNYARRACSLLGTFAGAVSVAAGMARGAEIGAAGGLLVSGPGGAFFGGIAGAIIGGIVGGTAGGATGAKLGSFMDDNILNNYRCLSCKFDFDKKCAALYADDDPDDEQSYFHRYQGEQSPGTRHPHYRHPRQDPYHEGDPESGYY